MRGASAARALPVLRGVVFDMDGTLTVPNLDFKAMYERCGVPASGDILAAVARMAPADAQRARDIIEEIEEEGRRTLQLMPGAVELLRWLDERAVPTALVTRNTARTVAHMHESLLGPAGVEPFAPAVSREVPPGMPHKPDPTALRAISALWDVPLGESLLMVGDSVANDVGFGKAAGVRTALLDSGRKAEEVDVGKVAAEGGAAADFCVGHLANLPAMLEAAYRTQLPDPSAAPLRLRERPVPAEGTFGEAAARGDLSALSTARAADLDAPDAWGNTPLVWAADAGHADAVAWLLARDADPRSQGYLGATALARASRGGHVAVVRALLADGRGRATIDTPNDQWQSPLHFAAFKRRPDVVSILLDAGASTTVVDRKGRTPAEDTADAQIRRAILRVRTHRQTPAVAAGLTL